MINTEMIMDEVQKKLKTEKVIETLALCCTVPVTEHDCEKAAKTCGCDPFAPGDVEFIAEASTDAAALSARRKMLDAWNALEKDQEKDGRWRDFFDEWMQRIYKPLVTEYETRREWIRRKHDCSYYGKPRFSYPWLAHA